MDDFKQWLQRHDREIQTLNEAIFHGSRTWDTEGLMHEMRQLRQAIQGMARPEELAEMQQTQERLTVAVVVSLLLSLATFVVQLIMLYGG